MQERKVTSVILSLNHEEKEGHILSIERQGLSAEYEVALHPICPSYLMSPPIKHDSSRLRRSRADQASEASTTAGSCPIGALRVPQTDIYTTESYTTELTVCH